MNKSQSVQFAPVAITGISCMFPRATGKGAFWANIKNGLDCITEIPESHWKLSDYYDPDPATPDHTHARTGGFLDAVPFNPLEFGISPNAIEATDTAQLLTLIAVRQALQDAGYDNGKDFNRDLVSVILGVTGAQELVIPLGARLYHPVFRETLRECGLNESDTEEIVKRINHKLVGWQEASFPGLLGNVVAGRVANRFDLGGSNCVVDAACAGSLSAMHMACMELQSGRSEMVITGGVDSFNDIFMYMCFSKTKAISAKGHARPFDKGGDGTIIGEGVGIVTLKLLDKATADGDKVYAVLRGLGASSDGKGNAIYAPSARGQKKALHRCYEGAGFSPDTIDLVEAHGTGTPVGDAIELEALTEVYRESREEGQWCALGSVKSQMGHAKAAAGIAGLIKAAMALHHKVLPPTIKVDDPLDPLAEKKTPFYLNTEKRPWVNRNGHPRRAAVSAFGFGGSNYHAVLEEAATDTVNADWDGDVQILAFSAENPEQLKNQLAKWETPASWDEFRETAQQARKNFNPEDDARLLMVIQHSDLPGDIINRALSRLNKESDNSWEIPTGIYYGTGKSPGKLAVVFSGQGTQYPGMLRDVACQFPEFINVLDQANVQFKEHSENSGDYRLSDMIYPVSAFTEDEKTAQVDNLKLTQHAQPGIGAVSIGAWNVLHHRFGIKVDAAAGHSYGEICALHAAGMITSEEFHILSSLRGRLMSAGDDDRGGMAAVTIPLDDIQKVLDEEQLELVIANKNAPAQGVISGKTEEIEKAINVFNQRNLRIIPLKVSAAFHSPLVADATKPFGEHLNSVKFKKGNFPVYSNTTGKEYPSKQKEIRDILAAQLENPVEFVEEIKQMHSDGVRTFLEVGPGHRMTGLIKAILDGKDFHGFAMDQSGGKKPGQGDLARTLAQLSALGYTVNLTAWDETFTRNVPENGSRAAMEVMICGANYVRPKDALPPFTVAPASTATTPGQPAATMAGPAMGQAFHAIQDNLVGLQRLQEQTAELHQQFLRSQQEAQVSFQSLIGQQQGILGVAPQQPVQHVQPLQPVQHVQPVQPVQPATAIPQPVYSTPQTPPPATPHQDLTPVLMDVVAEKTGYPTDLLEPSMELDADLGIDSIKRVEILSALQEKLPDMPGVQPEQMSDIRTLQDIVNFMESHAGPQTVSTVSAISAPPVAAVMSPPVQSTPPTTSGGISKSMLMDVVAEKTGYPTDLLEPEMELDADLGIDSIKRVEILSALQEKMPGLPQISPDKMASIRTLKDILVTVTMMESEQQVQEAPMTDTGARKKKKGIFDTQPIGIKKMPPIGNEQDVILGIISDKTGYPTDLLEPHMTLDADLGIDSIKRVEILSALKEVFTDLPDIQPDQMASIQTVKDVIGIVGRVRAARPGRAKTGPVTTHPRREEEVIETQQAAPPEPVPVPKPVTTTAPAPTPVPKPEPQKISDPVQETPSETVVKGLKRVHRGRLETVPVEGKRPRVKYPDHAEIWITRDDCGLSDQIFEEFENQFIPCRLVSPDYLEFVELPDQIAGLIMVGPRDSCSMGTLNKMFELVQLVSGKIRNTDENSTDHPLVVSIVRLDGEFGLSNRAVDFQPMTAALAGMVKTIQQEWPETRCKVIDVDADREYQPDITQLIEEFFAEGPLEVGMSAHGKVQLSLVDAPQEPERMTGEPLIPGNWVMVTGGARGVTAACALELARRFSVNLLLVGRSDPPAAEPDWLRGIEGEAAIKKAILNHTKTKLSPKELNGLYEYRMKNREILNTMEKMMLTGVKVRYESVDVKDPDALSALFHQLGREKIIIEGLVHGAGVIADKRIEDKNPENFDKVIRTKVESLRHISENLDLDRLKILVLFSSSTARFGRTGQVDYAMANEVLNKFAQKFSRVFPQCITLSMNWGPWDGGMVTPDLKKLFRAEGIEVIDLESGARFLSRELRMEFGQTVNRPVELVVLGSQDPDNELPGDIEPVWNDRDDGASDDHEPQDDEIDDELDDGEEEYEETSQEVFSIELSDKKLPVLKSHLINGLPVVPMALLMEFAARGAKIKHPSLFLFSLENFRLLKGIILRPDTSLQLDCKVGEAVREDRYFRVPVELRSLLPDGRKFVHVSTDVILAPRLPEAPEPPTPLDNPEPYPIHQGQLYSEVLFHGDMLQSIRSVEGVNESGITAAVDGVPDPAEWMQEPMSDSWLTDPMSNDAAFQLMILWTELMLDMPSLPCGLAAYRQFTQDLPEWSTADIRIKDNRGNQVFADIFFKNDDGEVVALIEAYECITDKALRDAFKITRTND